MLNLSISFETNRILIAELKSSGEALSLTRSESMTANIDFYQEALDKGNPKFLTEIAKRLSDKLSGFPQSELAVCLNMTSVRCLLAYFNRNLSEDEFEEECDIETESFLREPDEYSREAVKLYDKPDAPFNSYLLIYLPKRFLTRLQMLFLPSGKSIASVEFSHFAVQRLYNAASQHVLMELDNSYVAISKLVNGSTSLFKYWRIEAETDVAYFAVNELKSITGVATVSAFGAMANESVLDFIKSATGKPIQLLQVPNHLKVESGANPVAPFLPAIGCAMQAFEVA